MIIVIGGPTSSGKSSLAYYLAKKLGGEIISLDASQVYREMRIGSGVETCEVPQHIIEIFDPNEAVDPARVVDLAKQALVEIQSKGKIPIIVAGSTLYLTLFLHGLAQVPGASKELREEWKSRSTESLFEELKQHDPDIDLSKNDRPRIERALEVKLATGRSIRDFQAEHGFKSTIPGVRMVCLWWNRQRLYKRIEERCEKMLSSGLLDEVKALSLKYGSDYPGLKSIGYHGFSEVLSEKKSLEVATKEFIQETRNYAKRQMTYWKNEPKKRGWIVEPTSGATRGDEVTLNKGPRAKGVFVYEFSKEELLEKILQTGENHLLNVAGELL